VARRSLTPEQVLTALAATPERIAALAAGVPPAALHASPSDGEWSANGVLAHLRSCADVWGSCIEAMLAEDAPTLRAVNPTTWIKQTDYPEQQFQPSCARSRGSVPTSWPSWNHCRTTAGRAWRR
jgi:hypothetical protein